MKKNYQILLLITLLTLSYTVMTKTKYKKPYYGIKLDLAQVGVDIRLNDIPVYYDDEKGQLTVDLPAPSSVINGKNTLKIIAFPPYIDDENKMDKFLPDSVVTATLYVQEIDDPDNNKEIITSISIKFSDNSTAEIINTNETEYNEDQVVLLQNTTRETVVSRSVEFESGFPDWEWQDGKNIENNSDNFNSLMNTYKNIHTIFTDKNQSEVFNIYDIRAKEIATAYHLADPKEGHLKISTGSDMNDPSLALHEFWTEGMKLEIIANGKMARITDTDKDQPILFIDKESGTLHLHKFSFYKSNNDEWIMIR
ncbi:MAG: hypothetical protein DIZ80_06860 [endosymbiont of Galathealinum brachiosum]|uniref:Uncharacterized protein n=1 Tax=endosymbiont of Galathealinum brachiosum TaxID=2200906 RepID=A0A370DG07_9GAMM|nr:MAG: hypothetical protein DIZ80_06860 [endosymbiont of Galathealinum brachiosum]